MCSTLVSSIDSHPIEALMGSISELPALPNKNLQAIIDRIKSYVAEHAEWAKEAAPYIQTLDNFIFFNQKALKFKRENDPHFSAFKCVALDDLPGLKLLVLNGEDVNQQTLRSGKTALHLAASLAKFKALEILLTHPDIDLTVLTKDGKLAHELATHESIQKLLAVTKMA